MNHLSDFDNEELLSAHAQLSGKLMQRYLSEEEQTQLREMQEELLRRMTAAAESHCRMGVACPLHDGQVHGQEASELRTKLEKYINRIDVIENGSDVTKELQHILDSTDARDSLAFEEQVAVEFICSSEHSDVPELTPGTLEYQINQLSLANAQLVSEIEKIRSAQLGTINLRGKLEAWIELKNSWSGLAAEVQSILDSTDDQEFEELVAVDSIVKAVSEIQVNLKVLTKEK